MELAAVELHKVVNLLPASKSLLHLIQLFSDANSDVSEELFSLQICPAIENSLTHLTLIAGIDESFADSFANIEKVDSLSE